MTQIPLKELVPQEELMASGHLACPGCGGSLAMRLVLKTLGPKTIVTLPACCWTIVAGPWPQSSLGVPLFHTAFETAASAASGIRVSLDMKGDTETTVVAWAGDGGTFDIGLQALSGAAERNEDILYVCYDNEAYMNTGVQRSGATPPAARTATTPAVGPEPGNRFGQGKDLPAIAMAHRIPYVATATVADLRDLEAKVEYAMTLRGARYLHVLVPCPLGWGTPAGETIRLARLAAESGLFPVFEAEHGEVTGARPIRRPVAVEDYLRPQTRYRHLFEPVRRDDVIAALQAEADRNIARFGLVPEGATS